MSRVTFLYTQRIGRTLCAACVAWSMVAPLWAGDGGRLQDEALNYRAQGLELQQHGDTNGAMGMLQKAIQLDPSYPTPHNDLGILYESIGRLDDAEHEYQAALALNPSYAKAHTNLALLYERQGKKDLAAAHWFQRYTLGAPSDPWARTAKERLVALGYLQPDATASQPTPSAANETASAKTTSAPAPMQPAQPRVSSSPSAAPVPAAQPMTPPAEPPPSLDMPMSSEQRAIQDEMRHHQMILREFDAVTTTGTRSR